MRNYSSHQLQSNMNQKRTRVYIREKDPSDSQRLRYLALYRLLSTTVSASSNRTNINSSLAPHRYLSSWFFPGHGCLPARCQQREASLRPFFPLWVWCPDLLSTIFFSLGALCICRPEKWRLRMERWQVGMLGVGMRVGVSQSKSFLLIGRVFR
jgi:hypothetical protein